MNLWSLKQYKTFWKTNYFMYAKTPQTYKLWFEQKNIYILSEKKFYKLWYYCTMRQFQSHFKFYETKKECEETLMWINIRYKIHFTIIIFNKSQGLMNINNSHLHHYFLLHNVIATFFTGEWSTKTVNSRK